MISTNGHGPKRTILYARVSTDEQARSGYSLAQQIDRHERILKLLEGRRKHANAETKRRLAEERTYTHKEATAFYKGLGEAVRKHVTDSKTLNVIIDDVAAIAGRADIDIPLAPEAQRPSEQEG